MRPWPRWKRNWGESKRWPTSSASSGKPSGACTVAEARRFATVALVGIPNSGKSTLLNALVGEKLAAVSQTPQTTRGRILGVVNR
ncbi:MAG TPA: 50S ribosome-binding GTPase, partial [Holophaga sp.]|nr:50S ribosome-binding GTPase [Holophaga sp.]